MRDPVERLTMSMRNSHLLRLFILGVLALLLQIPVAMISGLVTERQQRSADAVAEVSSKWGGAQSITGPALIVPYVVRHTDGAHGQQVERRSAVFLPEQLHVHGTMRSEVRHRGIFAVPVYGLGLQLDGDFTRPDFSELGVSPGDVDWKRAQLAVGISDARAIQTSTTLNWNGSSIGFLPGTAGLLGQRDGIHAPAAIPDSAQRIPFSFPLALNGSVSTDFVPFAQTTVVDLQGDYPHPSFQGKWLPVERTVGEKSFTAHWSVPYLGRGYPQSWASDADMRGAVDSTRFGVELVNPVDEYHMAARSVKYAFLFILLTFATIWLIEVLAGVRVHPIQYLMLGAALCLFYLLELALSEHVGFTIAYAVATAAVVGMVGAYSSAILRRTSRALIVAAGVAMLYGYLYLLLMNEDYALLIGSLGLFAALGAIMYATRRVDWYAAATRTTEGSDVALPARAP